MLLLRMVSAAPLILLNLMERIKLPGSVPAGHPLLQGASTHNRQRSASSLAVRRLNPYCLSASSVYLFFSTLLNAFHSFLKDQFLKIFLPQQAALEEDCRISCYCFFNIVSSTFVKGCVSILLLHSRIPDCWLPVNSSCFASVRTEGPIAVIHFLTYSFQCFSTGLYKG